MKKRSYHFARKRRQLQYLAKRLRRAVAAGEIVSDIPLRKLRHLSAELLPVFGSNGLRRALGGAALLLGLMGGVHAQAPVFAAPQVNPFGLVGAGTDSEYNFPAFADLDGDGDLDLLTAGYNYDTGDTWYYQENTSTNGEISFGAVQTDPFGLRGDFSLSGNATFVDLDTDGDLDILIGAEDYDNDFAPLLLYFENTGTAQTPAYATAVNEPFGLAASQDSLNINVISTGDLDDDGDVDLLMTTYIGNNESGGFQTFFYENVSSEEEVAFADVAANPFGIALSGFTVLNNLIDIDGDGDLDLIGGSLGISGSDYLSQIVFLENTGTKEAPAFGPLRENVFGVDAVVADDLLRATTADLDGDGDQDLIATAYETGFRYYENSSPSAVEAVDANLAVNVSPNPTRGILTLDTDLDVAGVEAYDLSGRRVLGRPGSVQRLDLSGLDAGVYLIKVLTSAHRFRTFRVEKF